jgi:hypothetical protein
MRRAWMLVLAIGFMCGLSGCTAEDKTGFSIDLSNLNWQTIAILAGALLTPFNAILKPFTAALQPFVAILQRIGILKAPVTPDDTPNELTIAELIAILTDLLARTNDQAVKTQLLALIATATGVTEPSGKVVASAKGK